MPARTSANRDLCSEADLSDGWDMVVIRRLGAPPLRFAGRELCSGRDGDLAIRIWAAKTGGYVLSHGLPTPGTMTASRHAAADEVMAALEAFCRDVAEAGPLPLDLASARRLHLADLLEEIARQADWQRRFSRLVGETLDSFETCVLSDATRHAGAEG